MKLRIRSFLNAAFFGAVLLLTCFRGIAFADAELVVTKPATAKEQLHFGDTLEIKATGSEAKAILAEAGKSTANRKLTLYLDGIEIPGLQTGYEVTDGETVVLIHFIVDRNSEEESSRKAWDALFRPKSGYEFPLAVAVAVGGRNPEPVEGPGKARGVTFAASAHIKYGVIIGVVMLLACVGILLKWPHMLRENGNPELAFSLGRTQMAFWGIVVLSCFVGVAAACHSLEYIPAQVLVLLGISAATGLSAKVMDSGTPPTPKSSRAGTSKVLGFFDDICIGDQGASFHRVQVVLWTIVLGIYFVLNVIQLMSMPMFSETLLVLMGISNGTYLGFKSQEKDKGNPGNPDATASLSVGPLKVKIEGQTVSLSSEITGGKAPYPWSLTGEPAENVAADGGTMDAAGTLEVGLKDLKGDCMVTLTVTDSNGAKLPVSVEVKKPVG